MLKTICTKELLSNNNVGNRKTELIYADIWYTLNQVLVEELIEKNCVELPAFGLIRIFRFKRKIKINDQGKPNLPVDWIKTKQGWKNGTLKTDRLIYHSRNWGIKIEWSRPKIKNITAYSFKASRTNGQQCNSGVLNKLWAHLASQDTNYLKIPMIN
jgi:hypothetical protein